MRKFRVIPFVLVSERNNKIAVLLCSPSPKRGAPLAYGAAASWSGLAIIKEQSPESLYNCALWVCWDCTGPEVYPVHSGALDQYWSGFVPHHLFMTRRRGGDFCPPKTDLESGLLLSRSASDEICRKISQNFSPAGVTSPSVARATPMAAARTSCR